MKLYNCTLYCTWHWCDVIYLLKEQIVRVPIGSPKAAIKMENEHFTDKKVKNIDLLELTYLNYLVLLQTQNRLLLILNTVSGGGNNTVDLLCCQMSRVVWSLFTSLIYSHTYLFSLELRASVGEGNASTTPGNGRVSSSSSNMIQSSETL